MKFYIIFFFILTSYQSFAQYHITELSDEDKEDRSSGILGKNEILLASMLYNNYKIQYSIDKQTWPARILKPDSAIEITLNDEFAFFFVKICNSHDSVECITYRLKPGLRYALKVSGDSGDVVIKSGK